MSEIKLRPSSAERWLNCPGSVKYGSTPPTEHTNDGILAHELIAKILDGGFDSIKFPNEEMGKAISAYIVYVWPIAIASDIWGIEEKIFIDKIMSNGTCDFWAVEGNTLHIVDFKYGTGKRVFARDNPQLMLYAYGMTNCLKLENFNFKQYKIHIVQPRKNKRGVFDKYTFSNKFLFDWIKRTIVPKVNDIYTNKISYQRGSWCWFCGGKFKCPPFLELKARKIFLGGKEMAGMNFILRKGFKCVYTHLGEKVPSLSGGEEFQTTILIPEDDGETLNILRASFDEALKKSHDTWGAKPGTVGKCKFEDVVKPISQDYDWATSYLTLKLKSTRDSIPCINASKEYIDAKSIKNGDIISVAGYFWAYNVNNIRGVTGYLESVLFIAKGEYIDCGEKKDVMEQWFPES